MSLLVIHGAVGTRVVSALSGSIELDSNTGKKSHTSERDRLCGKFLFSAVGIILVILRTGGKSRMV